MIDAQLDLFGGETLVTRKRTRPAPTADPAVQGVLFATDAGELAGQSAAVDLFGALPAEPETCTGCGRPITTPNSLPERLRTVGGRQCEACDLLDRL